MRHKTLIAVIIVWGICSICLLPVIYFGKQKIENIEQQLAFQEELIAVYTNLINNLEIIKSSQEQTLTQNNDGIGRVL